MKKLSYLALGLSVLSLTACNNASDTAGTDTAAADQSAFEGPSRPECIAPAQPGGGFNRIAGAQETNCKTPQRGCNHKTERLKN